MNNCILIGRLTKAPDIRQVGESNVCYGTIAVSRDFKNKDGEYETDFIDFRVWGKLADLVFKKEKGTRIGFTGAWRKDSYQKDNQTHFVQYLNVEKVHFLDDKKPSITSVPRIEIDTPSATNLNTIDDEDLPF